MVALHIRTATAHINRVTHTNCLTLVIGDTHGYSLHIWLRYTYEWQLRIWIASQIRIVSHIWEVTHVDTRYTYGYWMRVTHNGYALHIWILDTRYTYWIRVTHMDTCYTYEYWAPVTHNGCPLHIIDARYTYGYSRGRDMSYALNYVKYHTVVTLHTEKQGAPPHRHTPFVVVWCHVTFAYFMTYVPDLKECVTHIQRPRFEWTCDICMGPVSHINESCSAHLCCHGW